MNETKNKSFWILPVLKLSHTKENGCCCTYVEGQRAHHSTVKFITQSFCFCPQVQQSNAQKLIFMTTHGKDEWQKSRNIVKGRCEGEEDIYSEP